MPLWVNYYSSRQEVAVEELKQGSGPLMPFFNRTTRANHEDKWGPALVPSSFLKCCLFSEVQLLSRTSGEWKQAWRTDRPLLFVSMFEIKDNSTEGFFPSWDQQHMDPPPIQPDSLVFPSNFFLLSLCLASPSVPYIFFFFPPFYNILIQCFYTLSLCFSNAFRSAGTTQFFSLELTIFTSGPDLLRVTNRQSASLSRGKTPAPESECLRLELKYNTDLSIKMD